MEPSEGARGKGFAAPPDHLGLQGIYKHAMPNMRSSGTQEGNPSSMAASMRLFLDADSLDCGDDTCSTCKSRYADRRDQLIDIENMFVVCSSDCTMVARSRLGKKPSWRSPCFLLCYEASLVVSGGQNNTMAARYTYICPSPFNELVDAVTFSSLLK
jgi:hypothetical protein